VLQQAPESSHVLADKLCSICDQFKKLSSEDEMQGGNVEAQNFFMDIFGVHLLPQSVWMMMTDS
jgi:hypothetical protein